MNQQDFDRYCHLLWLAQTSEDAHEAARAHYEARVMFWRDQNGTEGGCVGARI